MADLELRPTALAVGGDAIARDPDGRVVFVTGALPGELVRAHLVEERRDFARARVLEVVEASDARRSPPCAHVADGCGGCGWQHVTPEAQVGLKADVVADSLRRLAHLDVDVVASSGSAGGRRTTVRLGVAPSGRPGYRRAGSNELVAIGSCLTAHPLLEALIVEGEPGEARELTFRCGARTGDRLVIAAPTAAGVRMPEGVVVIGEDELAAGRRAWLHEEVAGRRFRISARSFFQSSPEAAESIVAAVSEVARPAGEEAVPGTGRTPRMVDLYGGVGLFAGTVGAGYRTTLVERSSSSVADARANLADLGTRVLRLDVERWRPSRAELVVADPARAGLGKGGVASVVATRAPRVVLVSCDPAALGRDAALLVAAGYRLERCAVLDVFPDAPNVEAVTSFVREDGGVRG